MEIYWIWLFFILTADAINILKIINRGLGNGWWISLVYMLLTSLEINNVIKMFNYDQSMKKFSLYYIGMEMESFSYILWAWLLPFDNLDNCAVRMESG